MSSGKQSGKSIYFIVAAPVGISPSQRFRFEHYLDTLRQNNFRYKVSPYFSEKGRKALYSSSNILGKVLAIVKGYGRRIIDLFRILNYRFVYIHREAAPVGPPIFEWIVAKVFRKKLIYDFDDSIWVPAMSEYNKKFLSIRYFSKVAKICKWSHKVSVGNPYLKEFGDKYSNNVYVVPTVVNTETIHGSLQIQDTDKPAIGWTGSFSTLMYLDLVLPALQKLQEEVDFTFYVIADKDPALPLRNYKFIPWNKETETEDLLQFHVGLMPLTDDEITRGKCGFKAIQYMALGMPAIVSPVGVNTEIVSEGQDGFICNDINEWKARIRLLLLDTPLRKKMGIAARKKIEAQYSVKAVEALFLSMFE